MAKVNQIANAVDSSIVQKPIVMDVFHDEGTGWYVTFRSEGEERGTRQILANDIYTVIQKQLSIGGRGGVHIYKVNIYSLNLDYLLVPYNEPVDNIKNIYLNGNTEFVETRYVKTISEKVGKEEHLQIIVFDKGSKKEGKVKKFIWKPLFG
jgi:hypothetical protein